MSWEEVLSWLSENVTDCVSIVISFLALWFSLRQYYCERNRNRKEATIHAFDTLEGSDAVIFLFSCSSIQIDDYVQRRTEYDKRIDQEWASLSNALHLIEHFAVGINSKVYDIETLNSMAGNKIISTFCNCKTLLNHKRIGVGNMNNYSEFETMVNSLVQLRLKKKQAIPAVDNIQEKKQ